MRVALDLPALIRACLANLDPEAARRGIALEEELAPATVCGVRDHLVILLDNLVSNAVHYSHNKQSVWVTCLAKPDGRIAVVVRDQGIGIPAGKLPFIFDDYFRTSEAAAFNKASTGLGLALVRQAALADNIGVRVESAAGKGTVVTLDFPACSGEAERPN